MAVKTSDERRGRSGYRGPVRVTAHLLRDLAGEPPQLDGLLEWCCSLHANGKALPGYKVDRRYVAPPVAAIPIPVPRREIGGWPVAACSAPILPAELPEQVQHVTKRISVENALMLGPDERLIISTANSWTKSYRLPVRIRLVDRVVWFAWGDRRQILNCLRRHVWSIGKKLSIGHGRIRGWEVEPAPDDFTWFAPSEAGTVLMRTLPACDELPPDLIGCRNDFGACCPPYWHPERYTEILVPC